TAGFHVSPRPSARVRNGYVFKKSSKSLDTVGKGLAVESDCRVGLVALMVISSFYDLSFGNYRVIVERRIVIGSERPLVNVVPFPPKESVTGHGISRIRRVDTEQIYP